MFRGSLYSTQYTVYCTVCRPASQLASPQHTLLTFVDHGSCSSFTVFRARVHLKKGCCGAIPSPSGATFFPLGERKQNHMASVTGIHGFGPIGANPGQLGQIRANLMGLDKELRELDWGKSGPISGKSGAIKNVPFSQIGANFGQISGKFRPPPA